MEKLVNCRRFITMDIDATKTVVWEPWSSQIVSEKHKWA